MKAEADRLEQERISAEKKAVEQERNAAGLADRLQEEHLLERKKEAAAMKGEERVEHLKKLTLPLLKNACRDHGLKLTGSKADLIARLEEHFAQGSRESHGGVSAASRAHMHSARQQPAAPAPAPAPAKIMACKTATVPAAIEMDLDAKIVAYKTAKTAAAKPAGLDAKIAAYKKATKRI